MWLNTSTGKSGGISQSQQPAQQQEEEEKEEEQEQDQEQEGEEEEPLQLLQWNRGGYGNWSFHM